MIPWDSIPYRQHKNHPEYQWGTSTELSLWCHHNQHSYGRSQNRVTSDALCDSEKIMWNLRITYQEDSNPAEFFWNSMIRINYLVEQNIAYFGLKDYFWYKGGIIFYREAGSFRAHEGGSECWALTWNFVQCPASTWEWDCQCRAKVSGY